MTSSCVYNGSMPAEFKNTFQDYINDTGVGVTNVITSMTLGWGLLMLRSLISLLRKFLILQKYMICSLNHLFDGCHRNTCQKRNSVWCDVMISVAWIFTLHPLPCGYKQILRRHEHGGCFCKFYATKMLTFKMQPNKMYSLDPLSYITRCVSNSVFL